MGGVCDQLAVGGGEVAVGAWLPAVGGHTELSICGGLLLRLFVGLLAVLLHSVISFADDSLGLLLGSSGQHCCLGTGTGTGTGEEVEGQD